MPEQTIWRGHTSQLRNIGLFLFCALLVLVILGLFIFLHHNFRSRSVAPYLCWLLLIPTFIALARFLQTKNKIYALTSERLKITCGVFTKVTDTLELYRVKDLETRQPFLSRLLGLENVQVNTTDVSSPFVLIEAVPIALGLGDKIRNAVEIVRQQKRVREIDLE